MWEWGSTNPGKQLKTAIDYQKVAAAADAWKSTYATIQTMRTLMKNISALSKLYT